MPCKVLVVGKNSFIASAWSASAANVTLVSRDELATDLIGRHDIVVNCSISPHYSSAGYDEAADMDLMVARLAANAGKHFVMLSTRRVYGQHLHPQPLTEVTPLRPTDPYGANKAETERRVAALLGERCSILRLSNVFGYELGRRSFFGMALGKLRSEGRIVLDVSPFSVRDFIPVEALVGMLSLICEIRPSGIYNLGSSIGVAVGRIAEWLIEGYGRGELLVTSMAERDNFILDVRKLYSVLGCAPKEYDFNTIIRNIGKKLDHE